MLWDIDPALIETRGVGRAIYERAFPMITGKPLQQLARVAGRTELVIMRDTLQLHGIEPSEQTMRRLAAALAQGMTTLGRNWPPPAVSCPVPGRP